MFGLHAILGKTKTIDEVYDALKNREDLNLALVEDVRAGVMDNFETQSDNGKQWAGLALSTLKHRREIGRPFPAYKMLVNNPKVGLKGSIMTEADNDGGKIYTKKVYAAAQNFGYKPLKLPARPFMTLTEKSRSDIRKTLNHYTRKLGAK